MKIKQHTKNKTVLLFSILTITLSVTINTHAADNEWRCSNYASEAVEQNKQNQLAGCGFSGLRWNNDEEGQKRWCLTVPRSISSKENTIRKKQLDSCFQQKTARNNPNNQPKLPKSCQDSSHTFIPIKRLYSWYRYKREVYTAVKDNGVIKYDFNADGHKDYIFIERDNANTVRLAYCISTPTAYQRRLSNVKFNANSDDLSSLRYSFYMKNGAFNIDINTFAHNEGSCFATGAYSYNQSTQKFKMISSNADCSPVFDPITGEEYPIYPPELPDL